MLSSYGSDQITESNVMSKKSFKTFVLHNDASIDLITAPSPTSTFIPTNLTKPTILNKKQIAEIYADKVDSLSHPNYWWLGAQNQVYCAGDYYKDSYWHVFSHCNERIKYTLLLNWFHTSLVLEFDGLLNPGEDRIVLFDPTKAYSDFWFLGFTIEILSDKAPSCTPPGGDPVDLTTGLLYESATDDIIYSLNSIAIRRYYDNASGWQFSYTDHLDIKTSDYYATLSLFGGFRFNFDFNLASSNNDIIPLGSSTGLLNVNSDHTVVTYYAPDNDALAFNYSTGKLIKVVNPKGLVQMMGYDSHGNLNSIADAFGHTVSIVSHEGKFDSVTGPDGYTIHYHYSNDGHDNLTEVDYPSGRKIYYQYANTAYPTYLTAILDANKKTVSAWTYNSQGQAITNIMGQ